MKITQLKIKIKSLAEEARIIRREERKLYDKIKSYQKRHGQTDVDETTTKLNWIIDSLITHRKGTVRWEARHSLIVYRMMKGYSYKETEPRANTFPDLQKIHDMAVRFNIEKIALWTWLLEAQRELENRGWKQIVKVCKHRYIKYPLREDDKAVLTQELLEEYGKPPAITFREKILAKVFDK